VRAVVVRAVWPAFAALALCACATAEKPGDPAAGNWTIQQTVDRINDATSPRVFLASTASNNRRGPVGPTIVQLMCFDKAPIVRFAFEAKVGVNNTLVLEYRFDQNPGRKATARVLSDHQTVVIEDKAAVAQFLQELTRSNVLYVRITSLTAGTTEAEYRLAGAPVAIETAYAGCPARSA
jgi:hypothetical protein